MKIYDYILFLFRFISNFACLSCDGKWEEHVTLYEDEEIRKELGKTVGEDYYPLADVPEIQKEFLRKLDEEAAKKSAAEANDQSPTKTVSDVARLEADMSVVSLVEEGRVTSFGEKNLTLPARDKPEKSVRLMKEQGMLRKY